MMRTTGLLITLAVATLIAVPAFSMPWDKVPGRHGGFDGMNLTEEEMENMTLGELRAMRQEMNVAQSPREGETGDSPMYQRSRSPGPMDRGAMNQGPGARGPMDRCFGCPSILMMDLTYEEIKNMTLAELSDLRAEKMAELGNMTSEEIEALWQEKRLEMENMTLAELRESRQDRPFLGFGACLLATDITLEELEGMTLAEIEALREEKIGELEKMTIGELEELNEAWRTEMENMTLAELSEQREVCSILGLGADGMRGRQGCQGERFGMGSPGMRQGYPECQFGTRASGMEDQGRGVFGGRMKKAGFPGEE
jgi:hypothetical protein